jgi:ribonucrease Y
MADGAAVTIALMAAGAVVGVVAGALAGRAARARRRGPPVPSAAEQAARMRAEAEAERTAVVRDAEIAAREEVLALWAQAEPGLNLREEELTRLAIELAQKEVDAGTSTRELQEGRDRLQAREAPLTAHEQQRAAHHREMDGALAAVRAMLERVAGERTEDLRRALFEAEAEAARAAGAQLVRQVTEVAGDPECVRRANRLLGIAVGRFEGHYLCERHHALVPIGAPRNGRPVIGDADLKAIEAVANVKLSLTEAFDAVRIEGLDGVGREVARRAMRHLLRRRTVGGEAAVMRIAKEVATELEREVIDLGRRAFAVLEIPRAHPEIVKLVGRLNWRTSYTQNQWKHAIEAAFLCGMMAQELGLDRKLARRAALMHDIGKALTHELDGSHAVLGADYARRLGETEVVANAIGAHHTDEPFESPYAYLVAAADAMSGARPGARRQSEDNYVAKIADLERISRGFGGVAEAFAVQGGREVRIVVREGEVDDLGAVKLSTRIAETISREMTFPGQIRVTVIREFKAVDTAG